MNNNGWQERCDKKEDGTVHVSRYYGGWRAWDLHRIENCLCEDGVRRTVYKTAEPDTFFSTPAKVSVKGKTVTGFITHDFEQGWMFIAYSYGKNGHLLKEQTA